MKNRSNPFFRACFSRVWRKSLASGVALAMTTVAMPSESMAESVTYSYLFNKEINGPTIEFALETFTLPKFGSSGFTLTGASTSVYGTIEYRIFVDARNTIGEGGYIYQITQTSNFVTEINSGPPEEFRSTLFTFGDINTYDTYAVYAGEYASSNRVIDVVGQSMDHSSGDHLFLLSKEGDITFTGINTYNQYLESFFLGPTLSDFYSNVSLTYAITYVFSVPEPSTWSTMIIGFFGCGIALRGRRALAMKSPGFRRGSLV